LRSKLVLLPDRKLVTVGRSLPSVGPGAVLTLLRFKPDGSLDGSFGNGGRVMLSFLEDIFPEALIVQPDGKLVVAAATGNECVSI